MRIANAAASPGTHSAARREYRPAWARLVVFIFVVAGLFLLISGAYKLGRLDDVRCAFLDANDDVALRIDVGSSTVLYYSLRYELPGDSATLLQILGPYRIPGDPDSAAITLCGGDVTCAQLEDATCLDAGLPAGCGLIKGEIRRLDMTIPDVPIEPMGTLKNTVHDVRNFPEDYRFLLQTTLNPGGYETRRSETCK